MSASSKDQPGPWASIREEVLSYQTPFTPLDSILSSLPIPPRLSSLPLHRLTPPIQMIVTRRLEGGRLVLVPIKEYEEGGIRRALLAEEVRREMEKQCPSLSLVLGSIVETRLFSPLDRPSSFPSFISHFVARVESVWSEPLMIIRAPGNMVQVILEVDLSQPGRCRREIHEEGGDFFILVSRYGVEVSISTRRLSPFISTQLMMEEGSSLECTSILIGGAPTPFRILDNCRVIKKMKGEEDMMIPVRRGKIKDKMMYKKRGAE